MLYHVVLNLLTEYQNIKRLGLLIGNTKHVSHYTSLHSMLADIVFLFNQGSFLKYPHTGTTIHRFTLVSNLISERMFLDKSSVCPSDS